MQPATKALLATLATIPVIGLITAFTIYSPLWLFLSVVGVVLLGAIYTTFHSAFSDG